MSINLKALVQSEALACAHLSTSSKADDGHLGISTGECHGIIGEWELALFARAVANVILDELESKNEEVEIDSEGGGYVGRAVCLRHFGFLRMEVNRNG
jgi:hypothetical protein